MQTQQRIGLKGHRYRLETLAYSFMLISSRLTPCATQPNAESHSSESHSGRWTEDKTQFQVSAICVPYSILSWVHVLFQEAANVTVLIHNKPHVHMMVAKVSSS